MQTCHVISHFIPSFSTSYTVNYTGHTQHSNNSSPSPAKKIARFVTVTQTVHRTPSPSCACTIIKYQYQPLAEKKRRRLFCVAAAATTASSSPRTAATTCSNQVCKVKEVQGGEYAARTACSSRPLTTTHHYLQHVHEVARLAAVLDHVAFLPLGGLLRFGPRERPSVAVAGVCALDGAPVG